MSLYVNGKAAGTATGGYLPETFDITDLLQTGANTLAVIVDNRVSQQFQLNTALFWNYGGIFADVHLDRTSAVALTEFSATGAANGTLTLRATGVNTSGATQKITTTVKITDPSGAALPSTPVTFTLPSGSPKVTSAPVTVTVTSPKLWSQDQPKLYTVTLAVPAGQGTVAPVRTGFRDVVINGNQLLLNGKVLAGLRGFNRHMDHPGLGRAQPDGLAARELKQLRDHGFAIFRPAHYPTTPGELAAADELGLLVIEEVNVTQVYDPATLSGPKVVGFGKDRLTKMIARDRSHPSLIGFSVGNENGTNSATGAGYIQQMVAYGKTLDTTRLYTHMTGWGTADAAFGFDDFVSVNMYDGWYGDTFATLTDPNGGQYSLVAVEQKAGTKPILLSEYGAEAFPGKDGFVKGTEYYQGLMIDEFHRLLDGRPGLVGTMYWTSSEFTMPGSGSSVTPWPVPGFHQKGLMTYWRDYQKLGWRVMFTPVRIDVPPPVVLSSATTPVPVTITVRDVKGAGAVGHLLVTPPQGCTVDAASVPVTVPAGGKVTSVLHLSGTPVANGTPGLVRMVIDAETEAQPRELVATAAYPSLAAAFDNVAITDDANPGASTFTTSQKSYSAQALAALGYTPGATVTHQNTSFTWPNVAPGQPDNVAATGQRIAISGTGTKLALLGTGTYGAQGGTFTVSCSDGTTLTHSLTLDDWYSAAPTTGDAAAVTTQYVNTPTGKVTHTANIWRADIPLSNTKSVVSLQLPASGSPPAGCLHIFAVTVS